MENPLISVIVPAYNIASYIEKSVASICAQSYENLEIVIVDDGSSDDTLSVVQKLEKQDQRIRVSTKENGGVTSARLRGVSEASGEWIGFVDGDDFIEPQMYERLMQNALEYQADISHCGYQMVFPKGHVDYYYNTGRLVQHDRQEGLSALLDGVYIEPGLWTKLFHRRLFDGMLNRGCMDTAIRNNEDLLMNYFLFREAEKSVYEDVCPYHYLLRPASATTAGISEYKLKDPLKVTRTILQDAEDMPAVYAAALQKYVRQMIADATRSCECQPKMIRPYRQEIRQELRGELRKIMTSDCLSGKMKLMAVWAGLLPDIYAGIHRIYARARGYDNIYSLDK